MQRRDLMQIMGVSALTSHLPMAASQGSTAAPLEAQTGWQNWSASLPASTDNIVTPRDMATLQKLIGETRGALRPVGSGHSWMPLVPADGAIVRLEHFAGVKSVDEKTARATLGAGARLKDCRRLWPSMGWPFAIWAILTCRHLRGRRRPQRMARASICRVWRRRSKVLNW